MTVPRKYDPTNPGFWDQLYQDGQDKWHIDGPAPAFVHLLERPNAPKPGRLIALASGRGYDALWFATHGFAVVGVDFAPTAVEFARNLAEELGLSAKARFDYGDIFRLSAEYIGAFDYALEYTCLLSLEHTQRREYVQLVYDLLKPGGLFIALFHHGGPIGPSLVPTPQEIDAAFGDLFTIEEIGPVTRTQAGSQSRELFGLLRKK